MGNDTFFFIITISLEFGMPLMDCAPYILQIQRIVESVHSFKFFFHSYIILGHLISHYITHDEKQEQII